MDIFSTIVLRHHRLISGSPAGYHSSCLLYGNHLLGFGYYPFHEWYLAPPPPPPPPPIRPLAGSDLPLLGPGLSRRGFAFPHSSLFYYPPSFHPLGLRANSCSPTWVRTAVNAPSPRSLFSTTVCGCPHLVLHIV